MNEAISLRQAEKRVFTIATQDGLADIFLGCLFLPWAIAPYFSAALGDFWSTAMFVPFWGLLMFGIWLVRRYVVRPRVGVVKFGAARKSRLRWFSVVMVALNGLALVAGLWFALSADRAAGRSATWMFGVSTLALFSTAGYFLEFNRLYVYGLLVFVCLPVGEWLYSNHGASHHGFPITFGIASGVMILVGLLVFIRLLRNNPLPREQKMSEEM